MDGTGRDYAEWNKSSGESQLSYGLTYMWSIRENMEDTGRRKEGWIGGNRKGADEAWETVDSEKQTEGFGGEGGGWLGELGGGYWGGHVLHGALGVVHEQLIL